ncbi:hypothetical protein FXO37_08401 [Capsicum annuum]|nr:hypothetical protein FXO37_08401 [Capsicum annuum]
MILLGLKLPGLPLSYWSLNSLSRIGSDLGKPVYADNCTTNVDCISYARILVIMDITKPLPQSIKVFDHNGGVVEHDIVYEWKPTYCDKYLQVGHNCQAKVKQQKNKEEGAKVQTTINLEKGEIKPANPQKGKHMRALWLRKDGEIMQPHLLILEKGSSSNTEDEGWK